MVCGVKNTSAVIDGVVSKGLCSDFRGRPQTPEVKNGAMLNPVPPKLTDYPPEDVSSPLGLMSHFGVSSNRAGFFFSGLLFLRVLSRSESTKSKKRTTKGIDT